jgi:hypothetical protein
MVRVPFERENSGESFYDDEECIELEERGGITILNTLP